MKMTLELITAYIFVFLAIAFIKVEINPFMWDIENRGVLIGAAPLLYVFICFIREFNKLDD